jgi:regulator of sirC expression with transglutaminase-like and TPR domain
MDPTARWRELLAGPADDVPLDEAALLIAAHARPSLARPALDMPTELARLDRLAGEVEGEGADGVGELLFHRLGITGNTRHYDDPDNSYLDRVLERGLGIPISLAVLLIEVGRRRGLPLEGVGMPGHFLVRDRGRPETLIDPFGGGRRVDDEACRTLFQRIAGPDAHLHPAMLAPTPTPDILARMLANLDRSFRGRQDPVSLAWVTRLRVAIPGQPVSLLVQAAGTLGELGCYDEAARILGDVLESGVLPEPAQIRAESQARVWQARLN